MNGLGNLLSIAGSLNIFNNKGITSLSGLDSLTFIGGYLWIRLNDTLTSLNGLGDIKAGSIKDLTIYENSLLSTCDVKAICEYLENPNGTIQIYNNAPGCNSPEEVEAACDTVGIYKIKLETEFSVYPNPTEKWLYIKPADPNSIYSFDFELRNIFGQLVQEEIYIQSSHYAMNVADLKAGVYFYVIKEKGIVVQQGKLIIK